MSGAACVTVWLDRTSSEHAWTVSLNRLGCAETLRWFAPDDAGKQEAIAFGRAYAHARFLAFWVSP
jgi:hypothetical protein